MVEKDLILSLYESTFRSKIEQHHFFAVLLRHWGNREVLEASLKIKTRYAAIDLETERLWNIISPQLPF